MPRTPFPEGMHQRAGEAAGMNGAHVAPHGSMLVAECTVQGLENPAALFQEQQQRSFSESTHAPFCPSLIGEAAAYQAMAPVRGPCSPERSVVSGSSSAAASAPADVEYVVSSTGASDHVTLVLSNIPTHVTRDDMLRFIRDVGYAGELSYFYMPFEGLRDKNLGCAYAAVADTDQAARLHGAVAGCAGAAEGIAVEACWPPEGMPYVEGATCSAAAAAEQASARAAAHLPLATTEPHLAGHASSRPGQVFSAGGRAKEGGHTPSASGGESPSDEAKDEENNATDAQAQAADGPVTIVIRNLPTRCTCDEVLGMIQDSGFAGEFECFYMPARFSGSRNKSFAFAVFANMEQATMFIDAVNGRQVGARTSTKEVIVEPAHRQLSMDRFPSATVRMRHSRWGLVVEAKQGEARPGAAPRRDSATGQGSRAGASGGSSSSSHWGLATSGSAAPPAAAPVDRAEHILLRLKL